MRCLEGTRCPRQDGTTLVGKRSLLVIRKGGAVSKTSRHTVAFSLRPPALQPHLRGSYATPQKGVRRRKAGAEQDALKHPKGVI
ncbi:MAG: hypothetical protein LBL06_00975 [Treponema sp.]|jgi:hypothetical protein|nr:hypothetical protein [Treponema sp.]